MKKLICSFSMFDLSQKVRLIDTDENVDEIISVTSMETMPSDLSELSHIYNCNNIHLIGLLLRWSFSAYTRDAVSFTLGCTGYFSVYKHFWL